VRTEELERPFEETGVRRRGIARLSKEAVTDRRVWNAGSIDPVAKQAEST